MKNPFLLLIWIKQVGHQDGDAQSSWQRWLRIVLPPCAVAAVREQGQTWVPGAQGAGERWGGVTAYCLGDVPCPCRLQEARSSPGGGGGTSWAAGRGLLGLGVLVVCAPCLEPPGQRG